MDSLSAVEFRNRLSTELPALDLPNTWLGKQLGQLGLDGVFRVLGDGLGIPSRHHTLTIRKTYTYHYFIYILMSINVYIMT